MCSTYIILHNRVFKVLNILWHKSVTSFLHTSTPIFTFVYAYSFYCLYDIVITVKTINSVCCCYVLSFYVFLFQFCYFNMSLTNNLICFLILFYGSLVNLINNNFWNKYYEYVFAIWSEYFCGIIFFCDRRILSFYQ